MYHNQGLTKLVSDCAAYDQLANYFKYIDPARHIYYYQQHILCMQQILHTQHAQQLQLNAYYSNQHQPNHQQLNVRNQRSNRQQEPGKIRFFHTSPDAPAVDVYINGEETPLRNMPYYQISPYFEYPAGTYQLSVYPTGQTNNPVLEETISIQSGESYTLAAAGLLEDIQLVVAVDEDTVEPDQTKLRFWHLSPNAPEVDIAMNDDIVFSDVSFTEATNYLQLSPTTADIEIRLAGTDDVVMTLHNTNLVGNQLYTIVAMGLVDGTPRFEATIILP